MSRLSSGMIAGWALMGVGLFGCAGIAVSRDSGSAVVAAVAAVCREAMVNPVSGYAECVDPRGAPVAPRRRDLRSTNLPYLSSNSRTPRPPLRLPVRPPISKA